MNLLLVTGIFPPDAGGPATHVSCLAETLAARGHRLALVTLSDEIQIKEVTNYKLIRIPRKSFYPLRFLRTFLAIRKHLQQSDCVYANGLYVETALARCFSKKPVFFKIVGDKIWDRLDLKGKTADSFDEFQKKPVPLRYRLAFWFRKKIFQKSKSLVVPSRYFVPIVKKWSEDKIPVSVIHNGVTPLPFKLVKRPRRIPNRLLLIARLIPRKRVDIAIQAIRDLDRPCQLQIIGSGPDEKRLRKMVEEGARHHEILWEGTLSLEETLEKMFEATCLLIPSSHENFPHVILEAMQCGLPVIASNIGGVPEIMRNGVNGLLVDDFKPSSWALAIKRVLDSISLQQKLRIQGLETIKRFSWDDMVDRIVTLLKGGAL